MISEGEAPLHGLHDDVPAALDALMHCWGQWDLYGDYYLDDLAPQIVVHGVPENARDNEIEAVATLQRWNVGMMYRRSGFKMSCNGYVFASTGLPSNFAG